MNLVVEAMAVASSSSDDCDDDDGRPKNPDAVTIGWTVRWKILPVDERDNDFSHDDEGDESTICSSIVLDIRIVITTCCTHRILLPVLVLVLPVWKTSME